MTRQDTTEDELGEILEELRRARASYRGTLAVSPDSERLVELAERIAELERQRFELAA